MKKLEYAFKKTNSINEAYTSEVLSTLVLFLVVGLLVLVIKFWLVPPRMFVSLLDGVKCNDNKLVVASLGINTDVQYEKLSRYGSTLTQDKKIQVLCVPSNPKPDKKDEMREMFTFSKYG